MADADVFLELVNLDADGAKVVSRVNVAGWSPEDKRGLALQMIASRAGLPGRYVVRDTGSSSPVTHIGRGSPPTIELRRLAMRIARFVVIVRAEPGEFVTIPTTLVEELVRLAGFDSIADAKAEGDTP